MSDYDDRHQSLRQQLSSTQESLAQLPDDQRAGAAAELKRLEETLGFTVAVVDQTDPDLVPEATSNALTQQVARITASIDDAAANPTSYADGLLAAVSQLPTGQREHVAQALKETIANFQRSAQMRLNHLTEQIDSAGAQLGELTGEIATRRQELTEAIEQQGAQAAQASQEQITALETKITELQTALEAERLRVESTATEQAEHFRRSQDERAEEARERERGFEERIAELEEGSKERVEALITEVEEMKDRGSKMVGTLGIIGTSDRYDEEAGDQKDAANLWRWITVALGLVAIAVALSAAGEPNAETIVSKLAISLILGGLGAYTARQSARHRAREERARWLQLDLAVFPSIIEPLPEEDQVEETVRLVRRTFRGVLPIPQDEDEPGPAPISQFVQRRRKAEDSTDA